MVVLNRRRMLTLSLTAAAGVLAGCGSAARDPGVDGSAAVSPEPAAFPVTIDHVFGSTTIDGAPSRIAVIGIGDADVLLALGVMPVMVPVWKGSTDDGIGEWAESRVAGHDPSALLNATADFSVAAVAAAQPDLILAVNNAIDEPTYRLLSSIAPTVLHAPEHTDWVLPWQEVTTRIGSAVGLPGAAQELVSGTEELVASRQRENPQFVGKTAAMVVRWGDGNLRVYSPEAARTQLLTGLGFAPPPTLASEFNGQLFVEVSLENIPMIDSDVIVFDNWQNSRAAMESLNLFSQLPAVRSGSLIGLDPIVSDAVSMPNPLTVPFVLDELVAQLRAISL
ncbi:ABC transporter substrate-binding protein [Gordonia terrae]|uniref:ABC transporter substrate-binding protein n=1 Tax=Gordonia terrae TaxID=2055 RepID=UPI003F6D799F